MDGRDTPELKLTINKTADQIQPRRLRRLLRRLVDIYSPSGKEEDVLSYVYGYMKKHGLPVMRQFVDDLLSGFLAADFESRDSLQVESH